MRDRLNGAVLVGGPGAAISGAAALALRRIRGVEVPRRPLVLAPLGNRSQSTMTTLQLRLSTRPSRVVIVDGVRVVSAARAVADFALDCGEDDMVLAVATEMLRRGLGTAAELRHEQLTGPRRGSKPLRRAVEAVTLNAWSLPEGMYARALQRSGSPPFRLNVPVLLVDGRTRKVDVWWDGRRAALEILGAEHHSSVSAWNATVRRAALIAETGIALLQLPAIDILRDPASAARRALTWLSAQRPE
jgi:hypothetical protein